MRTELLKEEEYDTLGYGAGEGSVNRKEFKCPCDNGKIIEEHDDIPGFRDHAVYIACKSCSVKYELDTSKGIRNWELLIKKSFDSIQLDLYDNALDSFIVAIDAFIRGEKFPKYYKISIKEMFSAFELILKDILKDEHESLIYTNVEDLAKPIHKRHSVNFDTLISRLSNLANFRVEDNNERLINKLRNYRNIGMHSTFDIHRLNAADLISKAVPIFINIHRKYYGVNYKLSDIFGKELFNEYLESETARTALSNDAKIRFELDGHKSTIIEDIVIRCIKCNSDLIVLEDRKLKCYCCHEEFYDYDFYRTFIGFEDELSDFELHDCPNCLSRSLTLFEPLDVYLCLVCGVHIEKVICNTCIREYPMSELNDITDNSGETIPDIFVFQCNECKYPYQDMD